MLIYEENLHKKIGVISQLGAEKITFPPKPDRHTDRHTYIQTDISVNRVASLLKIDIRSRLFGGFSHSISKSKTNLFEINLFVMLILG